MALAGASGSRSDGGIADTGAVPSGPCAAFDAKPNQICLGTQCLTLSEALRESLVLWLDPTTLPEAGAEIEYWCDRSGLGNHAERVLESVPLLVTNEERGIVPDLAKAVRLEGNWLRLPSTDSLTFRERDFVVVVAAKIPREHRQFTYLYRTQGTFVLQIRLTDVNGAIGEALILADDAERTSVRLESQSRGLYDDRFHLYAMRRAGGTEFQFRVDGATERAGALPRELDLSPEILQPVTGIGSVNFQNQPEASRGWISAVVAFKGPPMPAGGALPGSALGDADVAAVEEFMCRTLETCSGPLTTALDGGGL